MATKESPTPSSSFDRRVRIVWLSFVAASRSMTSPDPDDRAGDQLLPFREKVLALVLDEQFVEGLIGALAPENFAPRNGDGAPYVEALLAELSGVVRGVEVAQATAGPGKPGRLRRALGSMLPRASTAVGSVKDFVEIAGKESSWIKAGLTLFMELLDLFSRK